MLSVFSRLNKSRPTETKDLGSPAKLIVNTVLIFFVSQLVAALFVSLLMSAVDSTSLSKNLIDNSVPADFMYILLAEVSAIWLVLKIVKRRKLSLEFIGLGRKPIPKDLARAMAAFFIYYGLLILVNVVLELFFPNFKTDQKQNLGFNNIYGVYSVALAFFALTVLPPLGEEVLVRGYLYSGLKARINWKYAAIATSLLFAIAHLELGGGSALVWGAAIQTFVLSFVLIRLRDISGALYAGMILHFINNAIAFTVVYK